MSAPADTDIIRYLTADVHHMTLPKKKKQKKRATKKRWAVFQGNNNTQLYQLKLYKNNTEQVLKTSYTLTTENFVGIERGEIRRGNVTQSDYFAILLKTDSVIFCQEGDQETPSEEADDTFAELEELLSEIYRCESWPVLPRRGLQTSDLKLVFFCTRFGIAFGTLNPPECLRQLSLKEIADCRVEGRDFLVIELHDETQESIEVKCDGWDATTIRQTLLRIMRQTDGDEGDERKSEKSEERYSVAPTNMELKLGSPPL